MSPDWRKAGQDQADAVLALIPAEWRLATIPSPEEQRDVTGAYIHQFLTPREIEITETDAVGIVARTASGRWKCVEVARAFCHRAALAHQLVNCLHQIFFDHALAVAAELDAHYARHGRPRGPLHGLPVSLKDQFHVEGVETHMGYVGWIGTFQGQKGTGKERAFESEMVRELRSLGAVLFVKTSVPCTLMCGETVNNIVGYTRNPKNRLLGAGGSSGGEGALIGLRGSPVGFGTDIGGSVRIPSASNGLYGMRPSVGRLPYEGMANTMDGQNTILSVVGPLATTPAALKLVFEAILSTKPWLHDPLVHEIPWRTEAEVAVSDHFKRTARPLSFAVMRHDGCVAPTPPVARAVDMVVKAMEGLGHKVIDWKPEPTHGELNGVCWGCFQYDGGSDCRKDFELSGEVPPPQIISSDSAEVTASDIAQLNVEKRAFQKQYMEYWNRSSALTGTGEPVDAIIAPLAPFPASRPQMYTYYGYSFWVNALDYTSVIVPVTNVDKNVDKKLEGFKAIDETDQATQDTYDPEVYDGAHVSVQLVGRRLEEEKTIALASYVSEALKR